MNIIEELLPNCFVLQPTRLEDERGIFVKTFHADLFTGLGITFDIREEFYSTSKKGVLRGMHFQLPPHDHDKLVLCTEGRVLDVLLDLRSGPGYGRTAAVELTDENLFEVFIPKGVAHGFLALSDDALMLYKTSSVHAPSADSGIQWNSFGFDWGIADPITSKRDKGHPAFEAFVTPF
jgi:dTDP-4-dehydrorhamnose 3,5-epimerase/CDP-3, 6-dideoxy-D-glycero-D-glycero-4-hexulose-5-epimerase